ncbi:hypothetical protein ACQV5M_21425, partial [Leptospira sp. SA-E8]|uniref:hypothetical protein n=1 Tax=Leptospira sp. SA-E8 TaxID=3422259 RepID=UPI003EC1036F
MDVKPQSSSLVLSLARRPFEATRVTYAPAGRTLAELLHAEGLDLAGSSLGHWHVSVGGVDIAPVLWSRVRPKPGLVVEVIPVMRGENAQRNLAILAVIVIAAYTGGAAAAAYGSVAGSIASSVVMVAGMALVNKDLPPPLPQVT